MKPGSLFSLTNEDKTIFMDYVTDTHPIVWYFTEDPRLSVTALQVFEGTIKEGIIIVPAIVLAEIMFIA